MSEIVQDDMLYSPDAEDPHLVSIRVKVGYLILGFVSGFLATYITMGVL